MSVANLKPRPKPAPVKARPVIPKQEFTELSERRTPELVLGFVGPVGSGVSTTAQVTADLLTREYAYSAHQIRVSDIIRRAAPNIGAELPHAGASPHERISGFQKAGNALRKHYSHRYLAEKCVEVIAVDRIRPQEDSDPGYSEGAVDAPRLALPRRRVHIIDSLKHPAEVQLLREVYGDTFWLIGVFAPEQIRSARLKRLRHSPAELSRTIEDDEADGLPYGQRVRDTAHQADFFIRNDGENEERLRDTVSRFLRIVFNVGVNTPTRDETAMYKAMAQASTSACMSRQVGAAIYSASGELIGIGANDVPRHGGGLYCSEAGPEDHRCYKWLNGVCHNDERKRGLYNDIFKELLSQQLLKSTASSEQIEGALKRTDLKNLIEFSRAVHAEMEAIISVARGGKAGIVGSTLYSTTFPCHSCARHIVASGVARVVYIEPYAKSLALDLHGDAVSVLEADGRSKVVFLQYEGVAPKNMIRLFNHGQDRKKDGKAIHITLREASPVFPAPLDGFTMREQMVVDKIHSIEQNAATSASTVRGAKHDGEAKAAETASLPLGRPGGGATP